jgi:hypothetical protein
MGLIPFIRETLYSKRRFPNVAKFFNNAKGKIGRQKLGNNLDFITAIKTNWLGMDLGDDAIRRALKRTFFTYLNQRGRFLFYLMTLFMTYCNMVAF